MSHSKQKIVIIDHDSDLQGYLKKKLQRDGFVVKLYSTGINAIKELKFEDPNLILMELEFPVLKGKSLLREVKNIHPNVPLIVLTNRDSTQSVVTSFKLGADDYVTKPFDYNELLVRIDARIGSSDQKRKKIIKYKDLKIDLAQKRVFKNEKQLKLSQKEYALFVFLVKNKGRVFSREQLLEEVWGMEKFIISRSVDVYVGRLRKRLNDDEEKYIRTRRGFGYMVLAD